MKNLIPVSIIMTPSVFKNNHFLRNNIEKAKTSVSAFGIPTFLIQDLSQKINEFNGIPEYLSYLLNKYSPFLFGGMLPNGNLIKNKYQDEGLNLVYFKFRPKNEDWVELRVAAQFYGLSMNYLFVLLLCMDLSDFGEALGKEMAVEVPTIFPGRLIQLRVAYNKGTTEKSHRIEKHPKNYPIK